MLTCCYLRLLCHRLFEIEVVFLPCFLPVPNVKLTPNALSYDPHSVPVLQIYSVHWDLAWVGWKHAYHLVLMTFAIDFLASTRPRIQHSLPSKWDGAVLCIRQSPVVCDSEFSGRAFQSFIDPGTTHPDVSMGAVSRDSAARAKTVRQDKQYSRNSQISTFSYTLALWLK